MAGVVDMGQKASNVAHDLFFLQALKDFIP